MCFVMLFWIVFREGAFSGDMWIRVCWISSSVSRQAKVSKLSLVFWLNENVLMNRRYDCCLCYGLHWKKRILTWFETASRLWRCGFCSADIRLEFFDVGSAIV